MLDVSTLTREQAITEHRKMWSWIADETLKQKKKITKKDYFEKFGSAYLGVPKAGCFCCQYALKINKSEGCCIFEWPVTDRDDVEYAVCNYSVYGDWREAGDYIQAAEYARAMANLKELELLDIC